MSIAILIAIETFKRKGRDRPLLNILNENPSNRHSGSLTIRFGQSSLRVYSRVPCPRNVQLGGFKLFSRGLLTRLTYNKLIACSSFSAQRTLFLLLLVLFLLLPFLFLPFPLLSRVFFLGKTSPKKWNR